MRVISRRRLREFWIRHPDAESALRAWFAIASKAHWGRLLDVQQTYRDAEAVGELTVFDIKGNRYRLIAKVEYRLQIIFIRSVMTHAEYDRGNWK